MFPKGMLNLMWDCKSNARLAGTLYVMIGCKCPAGHLDGMMILLLSIYCVVLHTWLLQYVFLVARAFLPCQVRMININLLLCNKYYVTAGIYTVN